MDNQRGCVCYLYCDGHLCRYCAGKRAALPYGEVLPITTLSHSKIETGPLVRETEHVGGDWSPAQHTRRAS